jgi:hypothetical protein
MVFVTFSHGLRQFVCLSVCLIPAYAKMTIIGELYAYLKLPCPCLTSSDRQARQAREKRGRSCSFYRIKH